MYRRAVIRGDGAVDEFFTAFTAGHGANAHTTFFTGVCCHLVLLIKSLACNRIFYFKKLRSRIVFRLVRINSSEEK